jgi:hypothetical protein
MIQADFARKVLFSDTLTVGERLRMLNLDISVTDGLFQDFLTDRSFFPFRPSRVALDFSLFIDVVLIWRLK